MSFQVLFAVEALPTVSAEDHTCSNKRKHEIISGTKTSSDAENVEYGCHRDSMIWP